MLAVFADFDADLLKIRMCEGMAIAHSRGELKDRQANLFPRVRAAGGTSASERMDGASDYITPMAPAQPRHDAP
ncbi:hypothetical protein GCM10010402_38390 [Actinomadura luteofluorescens]|uniref:hypothetical protein n=1 Tax=Actinomadura luteofluorescens TaxID=46163 RepID=UPI002164C7DE|nr:hypothetical protein [Actinomadura glauciflava]MCR3740279.1 hypothetical protein [Actinomadura glauciflava]